MKTKFFSFSLRTSAIFVLFLVLLLVGAASSRDVQAANVVRAFTALSGGGTGAVDKIATASIADGDIAIAVVDGTVYIYQFDSAATNATSIPTYIRPADYSTAGVWCLVDVRAKSIVGGRASEPGMDFYDAECTDSDINGRIYVNCTATGTGAESCNMYMRVQVAGVLTTKMMIDAANGKIDLTGDVLASGVLDGLASAPTITTGDTETLGTGSYKRNLTLNNNTTSSNATTYTLPTAAAGREECIRNYTGRTGVLRFSISGTGQLIDVDGVLTTADTGSVTSGGAAGDSACVRGVNATTWLFIPSKGTWTRN